GVEQVVGIDYSARSVEVANRMYPHPKVSRFVGDVFAYPGEKADLIVSFQVIEHLRDPGAFLRACLDLARPGGWVVSVTPNVPRVGNRLRRLAGRPPQLIDPQHFREYTAQELFTIGAGVGLRPWGVFGHGLTLTVPVLGWPLLPSSLALRGGAIFPSVADS